MGDCKLTLQFDDNCVHNKFVLFPFSLRRFIPKDAETKNNLYFSPAANYHRVRRGPIYYFMNPKMSCYFQRRYKATEIKRAARLQGEGEDRRRQGGVGGGGTIAGLKKKCCRGHRCSLAPTHSRPPPPQTLNSAHKTFRGSGRLGNVRLEEREACRPARLTDKGQTGNTCKLLSGAADSRGGNRHHPPDQPRH